jgi:hypothetical protein
MINGTMYVIAVPSLGWRMFRSGDEPWHMRESACTPRTGTASCSDNAGRQAPGLTIHETRANIRLTDIDIRRPRANIRILDMSIRTARYRHPYRRYENPYRRYENPYRRYGWRVRARRGSAARAVAECACAFGVDAGNRGWP